MSTPNAVSDASPISDPEPIPDLELRLRRVFSDPSSRSHLLWGADDDEVRTWLFASGDSEHGSGSEATRESASSLAFAGILEPALGGESGHVRTCRELAAIGSDRGASRAG